jgi:hypothetical protein
MVRRSGHRGRSRPYGKPRAWIGLRQRRRADRAIARCPGCLIGILQHRETWSQGLRNPR